MILKFVDGGESLGTEGSKSRGGGGGGVGEDSDLLEDSVLRETENQLLDVLMNGNRKFESESTFRIKFDEMARTECMVARENLINVCQTSRFCQNSDAMRLSVEDMCVQVDELTEMSRRAVEQLLLILGVCCLCFLLYMILLVVEKITVHFFGTKKETGD